MLSAPEVKGDDFPWVWLWIWLDLDPEIPSESMHTKHTKQREQTQEREVEKRYSWSREKQGIMTPKLWLFGSLN